MFVVLVLLTLTAIMYIDVLVAKAEIQEQVKKIEQLTVDVSRQIKEK